MENPAHFCVEINTNGAETVCQPPAEAVYDTKSLVSELEGDARVALILLVSGSDT